MQVCTFTILTRLPIGYGLGYRLLVSMCVVFNFVGKCLGTKRFFRAYEKCAGFKKIIYIYYLKKKKKNGSSV